MTYNNPPKQHDPKYDNDDDFGPNEDGNDPLEEDKQVPEEVGSDLDESDEIELDKKLSHEVALGLLGSGELESDELEPDHFEPGELPVGPDEGPIPDGIPADPEHERVIDPGESWDPQATRIPLVPPARLPVEGARCP